MPSPGCGVQRHSTDVPQDIDGCLSPSGGFQELGRNMCSGAGLMERQALADLIKNHSQEGGHFGVWHTKVFSNSVPTTSRAERTCY